MNTNIEKNPTEKSVYNQIDIKVLMNKVIHAFIDHRPCL